MLSVSIPRAERAAFPHTVPMLRTGATSWPSGDHISLSSARKVFNSLLFKGQSDIKGRHWGIKKKNNWPNFRTHGATSFIWGHLRASLCRWETRQEVSLSWHWAIPVVPLIGSFLKRDMHGFLNNRYFLDSLFGKANILKWTFTRKVMRVEAQNTASGWAVRCFQQAKEGSFQSKANTHLTLFCFASAKGEMSAFALSGALLHTQILCMYLVNIT